MDQALEGGAYHRDAPAVRNARIHAEAISFLIFGKGLFRILKVISGRFSYLILMVFGAILVQGN